MTSISDLPEFQICVSKVPMNPAPSARSLEKFSLTVSICALTHDGNRFVSAPAIKFCSAEM